MWQKAYSLMQDSSLIFKLTSVSLREIIIFSDNFPCDVYQKINGVPHKIFTKNQSIDKSQLQKVIQENKSSLFIIKEDKKIIIENINKQLITKCRNLSQGNIENNIKNTMELLAIHMSYLYEKPNDNHIIKSHFQIVKNLANALVIRPHLISKMYNWYDKKQYYYIISQPIQSSLLVMGFLSEAKAIKESEIIVDTFITSYFKDIGMALLPQYLYKKKFLSEDELITISNHPEYSVNILSKNAPISKNQLDIILNHHNISSSKNKLDTLIGMETFIISAMDILCATIHTRPYREEIPLFTSLGILSNLFSDKHPHEFKLIVNYCKDFFQIK